MERRQPRNSLIPCDHSEQSTELPAIHRSLVEYFPNITQALSQPEATHHYQEEGFRLMKQCSRVKGISHIRATKGIYNTTSIGPHISNLLNHFSLEFISNALLTKDQHPKEFF